jgi:subtilisin family serine protease
LNIFINNVFNFFNRVRGKMKRSILSKEVLVILLLMITFSTLIYSVAACSYGMGRGRRNPTTTWTLDIMDVDQSFKKYPWITGKNVYVAIIDTGLCSYWDEFIPKDSIKMGWGRRFHDLGLDVEVATDVYPGPDIVESKDFVASNEEWLDEGHHGTKIVSYITGWNYKDSFTGKKYFFQGIAPGAKFIPIKVRTAYYLEDESTGEMYWGEAYTDAAMEAGINHVIDLAKKHKHDRFVVYLGGGVSSMEEIPLTIDAIDRAIKKNVVFVAAAGNMGFIAPGMPNEFRSMSYPAAYEPVISAGCAAYAYVDPETGVYLGEFAPFNPATLEFNPLQFLDDVPEGDNGLLCGPALGSSRGFPGQDLDVLGVGMLNNPGPGKKYDGQPADAARLYYYDDIIDYSGGTSGTAGQVAGICALLLQANPKLTPAEVEEILVETADEIAPSGPLPFAMSLVPPMSSFPEGTLLPAVWGTTLDMIFGTFYIPDYDISIPWMSDDGLDTSGGGLVQADSAVKAALKSRYHWWRW